MKKILCAMVIAGSTLFALAGCATYQSSPDGQSTSGPNHDVSSDPTTFYVKLSNGNQILCAGMNGLDGSNSAAPTTISCDWTNAQHLNKLATDAGN